MVALLKILQNLGELPPPRAHKTGPNLRVLALLEGRTQDPGLRRPLLLASGRGWRMQPGPVPTITREESRELEEQGKSE